jgi:hypothetical protein
LQIDELEKIRHDCERIIEGHGAEIERLRVELLAKDYTHWKPLGAPAPSTRLPRSSTLVNLRGPRNGITP